MTISQRTSLFVSALMMSAVLVGSNAFAGLTKIGNAGPWKILGDRSSCQASKTPKRADLDLFAIGVTKSETFLTFQNVSWNLPKTRTGKIPVKVALDRKTILNANAINIMNFNLQIITPTKPALWQKFLRAKTITISGNFRGPATIKLDNPSRIVPLMKTCMARYLPRTAAPF